MDDKNQNPPNQPAVNPQTSTSPPVSKSEKVIQPTEAILREAQSQPSATPTVTPYPAPQSAQPQLPPQQTHEVNPPSEKDQVPIGVSASSLGLNTPHSGGIEWKSLLKKVLVIIIVLAVIGGGWLIYKNITGYGIKTIQADGFSYSVYYDKSAKQTTLQGKTYLEGNDPVTHSTILMVVGKSIRTSYDCYRGPSGTVTVIEQPTIEGSQHNLCYSQSLNAYAMNFTYNGSWYFFTVFPKNSSDKVDQGTVESIANSIKIN